MLAPIFMCILLLGGALGDIYMQNPRGSNDRLNEASDRQNANRLFDSQNNARGGYCWGPAMSFVTGSILPIEWTAQHGCGGEHVTCNEVIQYMCTDTKGATDSEILRDGTTTNTIPTDPTQAVQRDNNGAGDLTYGMMEDLAYYTACYNRQRNMGLFIADRPVGDRATQTRQNQNGNRYGYECTEERDYYPYWHPSPWKDVAVLVQDTATCPYYQAESQNVKEKFYCDITINTNTRTPNNEAACGTAGGKWVSQPAFGIAPPACQEASFSRDNHLGNTIDGKTANFSWTLPSADVEPCILTSTCNCAIRIRYNITTNESTAADGGILDARNNSANSPITNNPDVTVDGNRYTLALNTAQYGRTFQDRSFMFHITPLPKGVSADTKIYNLNVRGKRGNIVQVYPATEYDYTPNDLKVEEGDVVHFQWTGCDTNPAGNQGEGRVQTDRSNIVQIKNLDSNIPLAAMSGVNTSIDHMFEDPKVRTRMAMIDQDPSQCVNTNNDQDVNNCAKLNQAGPYFDGGLVKMSKTGTFFYTSTRNNNFSNRTQKGTLTVNPKKAAASKIAIAVGVIGGVAVVAAACAGLLFYGKKNPHTPIGRMVEKLPNIPIERYMPSGRSAAPANSARREPLLSNP